MFLLHYKSALIRVKQFFIAKNIVYSITNSINNNNNERTSLPLPKFNSAAIKCEIFVRYILFFAAFIIALYLYKYTLHLQIDCLYHYVKAQIGRKRN
jgi:hypothetical protein